MAKVEPHIDLRSLALFANLSDAELTQIARDAKLRHVEAQKQVIWPGQLRHCVYVIVHGIVKVQVEGSDGEWAVLSILGANQVLGEMSLIDQGEPSASVVALAPTLLLAFDADRFAAHMHRIPALGVALSLVLSARLRIANQRLLTLTTLHGAQRVAQELLSLSRSYGERADHGSVKLPFRLIQEDIAALVGISRVRANQVLRSLVADGIVSYEGSYITILAPGRLVTASVQASLAAHAQG